METILLAQFAGAFFGLLAVLLGAIGAHRLKKSLTEQQLGSFETGVRYQMYHALLLILLAFNLNMNTPLERYMVYCFIMGVLLFSFSIYALILGASRGRKPTFLGPVTPIGGLLLVVGWALLCYHFVRNLV